MINFKNYSDLYNDIIDWSSSLPNIFDAIIGIPRSGIIPAYMLALHRNIACGDINSIVTDTFHHGYTRKVNNENIKNILIIDDTVNNGKTLKNTRNTLCEPYNKKYNIQYGALYITDRSKKLVDYYYKVLGKPRPFIWNIFHTGAMRNTYCDLDGVFCVDPKRQQNDDGPKYMEFIKNAKPLYIPSKSVHGIVTARLEKYRSETEKWLKKYNIKYNKLIMCPYSTKKERIKNKAHTTLKIKTYKQDAKAKLFIESSLKQSKLIFNETCKPVLCIENMQLFQ